MKNKLPYGNNREADASARVERVAGFARGGAVSDEGTRINITIGQPPSGPNASGPAILPPPPKPPMPPMAPGAPPAGAPPMGGLGGLGALPGMKSGGAVKKADGGPSVGSRAKRKEQNAD